MPILKHSSMPPAQVRPLSQSSLRLAEFPLRLPRRSLGEAGSLVIRSSYFKNALLIKPFLSFYAVLKPLLPIFTQISTNFRRMPPSGHPAFLSLFTTLSRFHHHVTPPLPSRIMKNWHHFAPFCDILPHYLKKLYPSRID